MFERVLLAMKGNDLAFMQEVYKKCLEKCRAVSLLSSGKIFSLLESSALLRNFNAEVFLPKRLQLVENTKKSAIALW